MREASYPQIEYQREAERSLIRRAREKGGSCLCSQGDVGAALRLTERGVGHWKQDHPFIFTFHLHEDFMPQKGMNRKELK